MSGTPLNVRGAASPPPDPVVTAVPGKIHLLGNSLWHAPAWPICCHLDEMAAEICTLVKPADVMAMLRSRARVQQHLSTADCGSPVPCRCPSPCRCCCQS
jgi:hypothetical protein